MQKKTARTRPKARPAPRTKTRPKTTTALVVRHPKAPAVALPSQAGYTVAADGSLQLGTLGLTELKLTVAEEKVLSASVDPALVLWKPSKKDGPANIPYLPHPVYTRWFNRAFGRTGWNLVPVGKPTKDEHNVVLMPYVLHIHQHPVAFAWGEQEYFPQKADGSSNRAQTYGDVIESTVASALRRCAKHLGIGLEMWDRAFLRRLPRPSGSHPRQSAPPDGSSQREEPPPAARHPHENEPITQVRMVNGKKVYGQLERLWSIIKSSGRTDAEIKTWLKERYGLDSTRKILRRDYDEIVQCIEAEGPLVRADTNEVKEADAILTDADISFGLK